MIAGFSALCLIAGTSGIKAATNTANNQTGTDQTSALKGKSTIHTTGVSGLVWEFFKVEKNATTGANLSPRAERGLPKRDGGAFLSGTNTTNGKKVISLRGKCDINSCARSTIMQIFNNDPLTKVLDKAGKPDINKPYMFLNAHQKNADGTWQMRIISYTGPAGGDIFNIDNDVFEFELSTNNKSAHLKITQKGVIKYDSTWDFQTKDTTGRAGNTIFRYGCYHHEPTEDRGEVRFRNVISSQVYPATPFTGL